MTKVKLSAPEELDDLMDAAGYEAFCKEGRLESTGCACWRQHEWCTAHDDGAALSVGAYRRAGRPSRLWTLAAPCGSAV